MATLEKRITDLEEKSDDTNLCVLYFCNDGGDKAQARLDAGISPDCQDKVVCVSFIESPNALKERP